MSAVCKVIQCGLVSHGSLHICFSASTESICVVQTSMKRGKTFPVFYFHRDLPEFNSLLLVRAVILVCNPRHDLEGGGSSGALHNRLHSVYSQPTGADGVPTPYSLLPTPFESLTRFLMNEVFALIVVRIGIRTVGLFLPTSIGSQ